jgi:hypothetical protein
MSRTFLSSLRVATLVVAGLAAGASQAQQPGDPPGRVAAVTERQGTVVYAPAGQEEWSDLPLNRPLTQADRLWTDPGARVELHMGNAMVYVDDESNLGIVALDDRTARLSLTQGTLDAHVRDLQAGESFEVATPNLAVRTAQAADWRVDVDPDTASTRVTVNAGQVNVVGRAGRAVTLAAGQQASFVARDLEQIETDRHARDGFDQWVAEHHRQVQQSQTAQYVPPEVIGSQQLDNHGVWNQDATYGPVWYPNVTVAEWAPYRQGHWTWIAPWGWTWIDDAPWGFAPFHYGRWAMIGSRWAWVPGRIAHRPVYAPALVAFVGGGSRFAFNARGNPGAAWYPLGPGEAWRPGFRASNAYVHNANRFHGNWPQGNGGHVHSRLAGTVTAPRFAQQAPPFVPQPQHGFGRYQGRAAPQMHVQPTPQFVPRQQVRPAVDGGERGQHRGWDRGNGGNGGNHGGHRGDDGGGRGHWQRGR